eukprot:796981-Lingulodinium_polyedra.AAC.1
MGKTPPGSGPAGLPINHNRASGKGLCPLHQHGYIQTKLANRRVTKGRPNLPEVEEGSICP